MSYNYSKDFIPKSLALATQSVAGASDASASALTVDLSAGQNVLLTLGAPLTTLSLTGTLAGMAARFLVIQGSGGANASLPAFGVTWPAFKWPSGSAPTLSTGVGAVDLVSALYTGAAWYADFALDVKAPA